jgi:hypothetical protein
MLPAPIDAFHQWLLTGTGELDEVVSLVITHPSGVNFAPSVAGYLNRYDDASQDRWLAVSPELLAMIAADRGLRGLLGLGDPCPNCPPDGPCGIKKILRAFAERGHVVLEHPLAGIATQDLESAFRIAVEPPSDEAGNCHAVINPEHFPERSMPGVISDLFLEWNETHRLTHAGGWREYPVTLEQSAPSTAA